MIPRGHRSHLFLKKDGVLLLPLMAWLFRAVKMLNELCIGFEKEKLCGEAYENYGSGMPMVHMTHKKA